MSNRKCCVPGCVNFQSFPLAQVNLHKFPNPDKDKELFNTWVYAIGGDILNLQNKHIFKHRRVCHAHFEDKYWCRNNRITNHAVPTLNMPGWVSTDVELDREERRRVVKSGLSLVKFNTAARVLRPLQISEPSTSKEPVAPQLQMHSSLIDVQMKENVEPVAPQLQMHCSLVDVQMKENVEPVAPQLQMHCSLVDVQMKENVEPVTSHVDSVAIQSLPHTSHSVHTQRFEEDMQIKEIHESRNVFRKSKRTVKRVPVTQSELALYNKLRLVGVKLSKYRSKVKKQAIKIKTLKNITTNPQIINALDKLSSTSKILTLLQFREHKKGDKGRRFTLKEKIVALSILKQSPKGYRFLRKILILPSRQTLLKLINMADINPGINKNMFEQIKKAAEKMKLQHKLCIVLFDEMSLKPNLTYNERKDRVCGFVTNGEQIMPEYADHAQVFMVRGLVKNYKQPVFYTFSQAATKGPELARQLKAVITSLQDAGLIVVATVCDQGTNNVHCIKHLLQETRGIFLRRLEESRHNIILINNQEIIPLYDPPHLIKGIRNNLITKHLKYKKDDEIKIAKWEHITALYKENPGYKGIKLVPKLTDLHCDPCKIPRMKVKFATQLFSQTVASNMGYLADKGIIPGEARSTADILLFFDQLYDSVNGSYGKRKKYGKPLLGPATPTSMHHQTWTHSKQMLREMKFINAKTFSEELVPTLNNWVWTLEGIELLLNNLFIKYKVNSVWLRHLNQDPIENFFGSIRNHGCRNTNPSPEKFESAFATLLINSLTGVHAPNANCEVDDCYALHEVLITAEGSKDQINLNLQGIPDVTFTPLEDKNDPRIIGGLQYVSGYFVKNAKKNIFKGCNECKKNVISDEQPEYLRYREYANKKWLCSPSNSLLNCISNLQDINYALLKENLEKQYIKEFIKTIILIHIDFNFIKCVVHKEKLINFLINISCRFFIYNYCKDINDILMNKRECDDDTDLFKIKAKKLCKKCFKRKK